MQIILLFAILTFLPIAGFDQTSEEFWFAAPEVTTGNGDEPNLIRVSTGDQPADTTISIKQRKQRGEKKRYLD